ncbi:MAG: ABC transporter ATP-binding protein [Verrucomicrobiota bacterium]
MAVADTSEAAVSIRRLCKHYGRVVAVRELNLEARRGEVLGFLGLNGAGKSTTIRVLLDLLRPTSGQALVFGSDCQRESLAVRRMIGYLPGELGLYADLTGREVLEFLGDIGPHRIDARYRAELQERLSLNDGDLRRRWSEHSTGMKRKVGIIQALQGQPPLLILDEPTEGLDPLVQSAFYELLADLRRRGQTVFMSSHVLSEVERVCDRIALLRQGELVLLATVAEVRKLAARRVRVTFAHDVQPPSAWPVGHEVIAVRPRSWELRVTVPLGSLLELLMPLAVVDMDVQEPRLEDVLLHYYRGRAG